MIALSAFIESVGLVGPGLNNWADAQDLLAGRAPYVAARTVVPAPASLPAAERRRTGTGVKLALAVGHEAVAGSGRDAASLAAVFAASGGDGQNCHVICVFADPFSQLGAQRAGRLLEHRHTGDGAVQRVERL
jgi:hypothetical protein